MQIKSWMATLTVFLLAAGATAPAQTVIYVDDDAPPDGNGLSWATAYDDLQDALAAAPDEIRVGGGTYQPSVQSEPGTPRTETFALVSGVGIYGGYAGYGAADPDVRDVVLYETILSGDIGIPVDDSDNSYHVVTGSGTDATAVLDGFTITAGNASEASYPHSYGGGMFNVEGSPTLTDCTLCGNSAGWGGGGMFNFDASSPTLTDCTLCGNSTDNDGGGIYNYASSPTLTNCTFSANSADWGGAGIYNYASSPTLANCTFSDNNARFGAGVLNRWYSSPALTNCTLSGNSANSGGGGMHNDDSNVTLTNCTFSGNSAEYDGGGMCNYNNSSPTLANCVLWGNMAPTGPQVNNGNSTPMFSFCDIADCGGSGGSWDPSLGTDGGGNIDADPVFVDPANDDYHLTADSPCIDTGDPAFVPQPGETDMDGEMRVWDGDDDGQARVDMGADEFGSFQYGDLNCDGVINGFDIDAFVLALQGPAYYDPVYPDCQLLLADVNADGEVNGFDIDAFIALLIRE